MTEARQPPSDLDAEAVVLSAVVLDQRWLADLPTALVPEAFYSRANGWIFRAAQELDRASLAVDLTSVKGWLADHGELQSVGGSPYLATVIDCSPAVLNVVQHSETVLAKWRLRQALELSQRLVATVSDAPLGSDTTESVAAELASVIASSPTRTPWGEAVTWEHVFGGRKPIQWLCRPIGMGPGLPVLFAGYGYSGKTVAVQALALAVMSGLPCWGCFGLERRGNVLHLDWEQGPDITSERYERLVRANGLTPRELERLDVRSMPARYLDQPGVEDDLVRMARGFELVVVDSFRAACPSVDEDSSEARGPIDMLRRVGIRTGASIAIIHHARKSGEKETRAKSQSVRGTGALFDAPSSVLLLEELPPAGPGRNRSRVEHRKARETGLTLDAFTLEIDDVGDFDRPRDGLSVRAVQDAPPPTQEEQGKAELESLRGKVLELLHRGPQASRSAIRAELRCNRSLLIAALDQLVAEGEVVEDGKRRGKAIRIPPAEEI